MKKVFFLTARFPYPLNKGDKLRAYHQIRTMSKVSSIHLITISEIEPLPSEIEALEIFCSSITNFTLPKSKRYFSVLSSIFSRKPFSVAYFFNKKIQREIANLVEKESPNFIHCHLIRMAEYVKEFSSINKSIDYMDCFSLGAKKEKKITFNWLKRIVLHFEHKRLIKYENESFDHFQKHTIISESDRNALPVQKKELVHVIPNGVDLDTFHPNDCEKKYDILFSGHMSYVPNIYAASYIINEIIPQISDQIKLLIAGIGVTKKIRNHANDTIVIQEHFNHIREAFWCSKILVAPMNISIGLQNKLLQAMAMKIPVICSYAANDSIGAVDGESVLLSNSPEEYAFTIHKILSDQQFYKSISENAYDLVKSKYNWDIIGNNLNNFLFNE